MTSLHRNNPIRALIVLTLILLMVLPGCATLTEGVHFRRSRKVTREPIGRESVNANIHYGGSPPPELPQPVIGYSIESDVSAEARAAIRHATHLQLEDVPNRGQQPAEGLVHSEAELPECKIRLLADEQQLFPDAGSSAGFACTDVAEDLSFFERVAADYRNYYSPQNLGFLTVGFGAGAIFANTHLDTDISHHVHASVQGAQTDEWAESFHSPKKFGNGFYTLPLFAAAWGVGSIFDETCAGEFSSEWGERSVRAFAVGVPPLLLMQKATGGSRPGERESHWHFWADNNGVSGHSFMGSLPFLTAAQLVDDPLWKTALYAGSLGVPISRVTDGDHYPSQAFLGWWMAWSAAMAVDATQDHDSHWRTVPLIGPGYSGLNLEYRW